MTKYSHKLKKLFLAHYSNFWGKKIVPENPALSRTTSHRILAPETPRQTEGRKDRGSDGGTDRPYFTGPFLLQLRFLYNKTRSSVMLCMREP